MHQCGCGFRNILSEIHYPIVTLFTPHYHPIMTPFDTPFTPYKPQTPKGCLVTKLVYTLVK